MVDTVTKRYNLFITKGEIYFRLGNGSSRYQLNTNHSMENNTWYHVAAVYNGTYITIYKNGAKLSGSTLFSGNIGTNSFNVSIGQRTGNQRRWKWQYR